MKEKVNTHGGGRKIGVGDRRGLNTEFAEEEHRDRREEIKALKGAGKRGRVLCGEWRK